MANNREIQLKISIDSSGAVTAVEHLGSSVAKSEDKVNLLNDAYARLGLRLDGIRNIFSLINGTVGDWIDESNSAKESSAKLEQSLKTQGIYSESLVNEIKAYAAARQEATGIDDDATIAVAGQLAAMGLRGKELKSAIDTTQDLATFMKVDLNTAVRLVGKSMQDGGEELSRYGIKLSDVRGQAIAMATETKKDDAVIADMKQSFGDLIQEVINPFHGLMRSVLVTLTEAPPIIRAVEISAIATGVAWATLNSHFGVTGFLVSGTLSSLFVLFTAIKNGHYVVAGVTVGVIAFGAALLFLDGGFARAAFAAGDYRLALQALWATMAANPILWIVAGVAAVGAGMYALFQHNQKVNEELSKTIHNAEAAAIGLDKIAKTIQDMTTSDVESYLKTLQQELANLEAQLVTMRTNKAIATAQSGIIGEMLLSFFTNTDEEISKLEGRAKAHAEMIGKLLDALKQRTDKSVKTESELTDYELELRKVRLQLMSEGYDKQKEKIKLAFDYEKQKIKERKDLLDDQKKKLINAYEEIYEKQKKALDALYTPLPKLAPSGLIQSPTKTPNIPAASKVKNIPSFGEIDVTSIKSQAETVQNLDNMIYEERDEHRREELMATRDTEQKKLDYMRASSEQRRQIYAEEHQVAMSVYQGIAAGAGQMWQSFVVKNRQAKDEWDAVWLAMRNTTLNVLGRILETQLENYLIDSAAHTANEETKTGVTVVNSIIRIGQKIAEAAASFVSAIAQSVAALGPLAIFGGAAVIAAGIAMFGGLKKAFGFNKGGQFEPDQRGFIEGGQTEIIAPRKNFEEIMRNEIMPMIARTQTIYLQRQGSSSGESGLSDVLRKEISSLKKVIKKQKTNVNIQSNYDIQKYTKANTIMERTKLAFVL